MSKKTPIEATQAYVAGQHPLGGLEYALIDRLRRPDDLDAERRPPARPLAALGGARGEDGTALAYLPQALQDVIAGHLDRAEKAALNKVLVGRLQTSTKQALLLRGAETYGFQTAPKDGRWQAHLERLAAKISPSNLLMAALRGNFVAICPSSHPRHDRLRRGPRQDLGRDVARGHRNGGVLQPPPRGPVRRRAKRRHPQFACSLDQMTFKPSFLFSPLGSGLYGPPGRVEMDGEAWPIPAGRAPRKMSGCLHEAHIGAPTVGGHELLRRKTIPSNVAMCTASEKGWS